MRLNKQLKFLTIVFFTNLFLFNYPFVKSSFAQTKSFFEGPYVGIDVGRAKAKDFNCEGTPDNCLNTNKLDGNIYGLHLGYNFPLTKDFYFSPVVEYKKGQNLKSDWTQQTPDDSGYCYYCMKTEFNHSMSLLGKVGYLIDEKNSINIVGGWTDVNLNRGIKDDDAGVTTSVTDKINSVPTYGFGYERVYNDKLSFVADYRHLKSKTLKSSEVYCGCEFFEYKQESLTAGINYKF